jgi:hypothetical protein
MKIPTEFITIESLSTPLACATVVYVICGSFQSAFNFNPKWLAFLLSIALSLLIHIFMEKSETHISIKILLGFLNGCVIYMTMLGFNTISNRGEASEGDGSGGMYGSTSDNQTSSRRKFNSPWI